MDEIVKTKMTAAERMAKARAVRDANRKAKLSEAAANTAEQHTTEVLNSGTDVNYVRQSKKPPILKQEASAPRANSRTSSDGRLEVIGRNGEVLSRTQVHSSDPFDIPVSMWPSGWTYQWNAVSVAGNKDILLDHNHQMYLNGWRPVPAERYAGTLVPKGSTGPIIRGQQMLMERPKALTDEAKAEDIRNAHQLISDRNESLKLAGVKKAMPTGFEMKGNASGIRMQIDKSLDVLNVNREAGNYKLDE